MNDKPDKMTSPKTQRAVKLCSISKRRASSLHDPFPHTIYTPADFRFRYPFSLLLRGPVGNRPTRYRFRMINSSSIFPVAFRGAWITIMK